MALVFVAAGSIAGFMIVPGTYINRLTEGRDEMETEMEIKKQTRTCASQSRLGNYYKSGLYDRQVQLCPYSDGFHTTTTTEIEVL